MFTVIIPLYNKEKYIERTLDSILAQTFQQFEIIIVNDGSTDNSLQLVKDYSSKDVRITVINQMNKGVPHARNVGLKLKKYKYVALIDADDFWHTEYLAIIEKVINKEKDIKIIGTRVQKKLATRKRIIDITYKNIPASEIFQYFIRHNPIFTCSSTVINFELFTGDVFYDERITQSGEDTDFWVKLFLDDGKEGKFILINNALACYSTDDEFQMTNQNSDKKELGKTAYFLLAFKYHEINNVKLHKFIASYAYDFLYDFTLKNSNKKDIAFAFKSLKCKDSLIEFLYKIKIFRSYVKKLIRLKNLFKSKNLLKLQNLKLD